MNRTVATVATATTGVQFRQVFVTPMRRYHRGLPNQFQQYSRPILNQYTCVRQQHYQQRQPVHIFAYSYRRLSSSNICLMMSDFALRNVNGCYQTSLTTTQTKAGPSLQIACYRNIHMYTSPNFLLILQRPNQHQRQQQQSQKLLTHARLFHSSNRLEKDDSTTDTSSTTTTTSTTESDTAAVSPPTTSEDVSTSKSSPGTASNDTPSEAPPEERKGKSTKGKSPPPPSPPAQATEGVRMVDVESIKPKLEGGPTIDADGVRQYSTPEITKDAKHHREGLNDPTCPQYQNPLYHNNPDLDTRFYREDFKSDEEFEVAVLPAPPLDNPDGTPTYPQYLLDLADDMVHLTMLEMNELINRMADHYGFHEGILSPEGSGDGADDGDDDDGDGGEAAKVEVEKTHFDVKLVSFDAAAKIKLIKEVRVIVPGLGLKEAKELVEGAPCTLQKGVNKEVADQSKEKLEALGAVIEIV